MHTSYVNTFNISICDWIAVPLPMMKHNGQAESPHGSQTKTEKRKVFMDMRNRGGFLAVSVLLGSLLLSSGLALAAAHTSATNNTKDGNGMTLQQAWDKTFPKSDKVDHQKVTFQNRYGITLAADLYLPKEAKGKMAAIAVSGPFGAVKGTGFRTLRPKHGRTRFCNLGL